MHTTPDYGITYICCTVKKKTKIYIELLVYRTTFETFDICRLRYPSCSNF